MKLEFLDFDYSEDAEGRGSFDAMAAAAPAHAPHLQVEICRVLEWAHRTFPSAKGPAEDGGEWDYELQGVQEVATTLAVHYEPRSHHLELEPQAAGAPRLTLSLTLTGSAGFCEAFRAAFQIE